MASSPMEEILLQVTEDYRIGKEKLVKSNFPKSITAFGSARIPSDSEHYKEIVEISALCAKRIKEKGKDIGFITGGGPSVMTAWLKGAYENGGNCAGISLVLAHETEKDQSPFVNKEASSMMRTFPARKALMMEYSKAIIIFKGGFGTMDEMFEVFTLIQTNKIPNIPVFVYPSDFYKGVFNFETFLADKTIKQEDIDRIQFCDTKQELIDKLYTLIDND
ncbi:MAG: LOG family protein [Rickettsiales bacterium]|nr:LOG family protein [Rickettsiales bacterium]